MADHDHAHDDEDELEHEDELDELDELELLEQSSGELELLLDERHSFGSKSFKTTLVAPTPPASLTVMV